MPQYRRAMQKISSTVPTSPFPQYCAPRMAAAETTALRIIFWMNCICVARDTAAMESWATLPSMTASAAATEASIRLCSAMGAVSCSSFLQKILSENMRSFISLHPFPFLNELSANNRAFFRSNSYPLFSGSY